MNWNNVTELELVEAYAAYHNPPKTYSQRLIESEDDLSDIFDEMVKEISSNNELLKIQNGDDLPMFREWFNNWTDELCKDGYLHPLQYHEYCYVGQYPN